MIEVKTRSLALVSLLGGLVVLGFAALFVKWSDAPGPVTALYRMLIGAMAITPGVLLGQRGRLRKLPRRGVLMAAIGGSLFGCDMAIWMTAIGLSGATMPTLMANTAPLWVGVGSILILKERKAPGFWLGVVIAIFGVALLFSQHLTAATGLGGGMVLGLVAALFYASFHLATQVGRRYLDTLAYLWISTISASAVLLIISLALRLPLTGFEARTWMSIVALGLLVQFLGWFLINFAQGYLRASIVAPVLLGQPVITALLAATFLGERLTRWHVIGGLMVLSGVYVVIWGRNRALRMEKEE